MMPEGEGVFDGGGSVRLEVKNLKDDGTKFSSDPDGNGNAGRKTKGVDKADGEVFQIVLKVPDDGSAPAFQAQFTMPPENGEILLHLNRENRNKQIKEQWPAVEIRSQTGS
jgi:hypothetical protein